MIKVYQYDLSGEIINSFNSQQEAADAVGISECAIRKRIKSKIIKDGYILSNDSEFEDVDSKIKNICSEENIDFDKVSQVWIKKKHYSINQKLEQSLTKLDIENIIEELVNKLPLQKISTVEIPSLNCKTLINWSSDKHIGAKTKKDSIYENEWNESVLNSRYDKMLYQIIEEKYNNGVFDKLIVVDLGDMTDGYEEKTMRSGHSLAQNMNTKEQFSISLESMLSYAQNLIGYSIANNYEFVFLTNCNHSSVIDYTVAYSFKKIIENLYKNVKVRVVEKFIESFSVYNHEFIVSHGKDSIDMKQGLPSVLDAKTEVYINDYIDNKQISGIIHFVKGDKHLCSEQYGKKFRYKNIPSMYGGNGWSATNFGSTRSGFVNEIIECDKESIVSKLVFFNK